MVLGANPRVPVANLGDLVAAARHEPTRFRFANPSFGSPHHLAYDLFAREAGIQVNSVDYRGGGPALNDVIAGHVELGVFTLGVGLPQFQAGTVRPLAIMSARRSELAPEIPSIAELGLPGAQVELRYFISLPAATPRDVVAALNAAVRAVVADPEFHAQLVRQGFEPGATSPEETEAGLRREFERWGPVLRAANIRLD
jgi:tripartite-type tricarboxylate transporter receptor subunit TctC